MVADSVGIRALDLEGRIGVQVGETELRDDDLGGLAVQLAARVMIQAGPGQILASSPVARRTTGDAHPLESMATSDPTVRSPALRTEPARHPRLDLDLPRSPA